MVFYDKPFLKFGRLLETYLAFAPSGFDSFNTSLPIWSKDKLYMDESIEKLNKDLYLDYSVKVQKICADLDIEFCDMNKMLGDTASAENGLFVDRAHLTDKGNMVVSERLYNIEKD